LDNLPIILGVVVVAAVLVYFLFFRKKAEEPARPRARGEEGKPAAKLEAKKAQKVEAERPPPPEARRGTHRAPESIPSQDVVAVEDSAKVPAIVEAPPAAGAPAASKKDVAGLRKGLAATRGGFMARLKAIFTGKKEIDPAILEQVEEVMISSDVGVKTTQTILERLRDGMQKNELADTDAVWAALRAEATRILAIGGPRPAMDAKPFVVLMVGVNGVGKTTTIGKLATMCNG
jgi:fused signal recognition particle receptor